MNRLTQRNSDGSVGIARFEYYNYQDFQKMASKLADYEDLEEQGRLLVLPCKIGDTVYQYGKAFTKCTAHDYAPQNGYDRVCVGCWKKCDSAPYDFLYEGMVVGFSIGKNVVSVCADWKDKFDTSFYDIGKTVFLTKQEAEAALKREQQGGKA